MDQLLEQQHQQDGTDNMSPDTLKTAFGGILSYLKTLNLDNFDLDKIKQALPDVNELVQKAETDNAATNRAEGGAASSLMSSAMNMLGGSDAQQQQPGASSSSSTAEGGGGGANSLMSSAMGMLSGSGTAGDQQQQAGASSSAAGASAESSPIESMPQLFAFLTKAGVEPKQVASFLPLVAGFLKQNAGVDVSSALGVPDTSTSTTQSSSTTTSTTNDTMGNLMNQASGFMSSFGKK